jgi:AcrR family transcriptional regulator
MRESLLAAGAVVAEEKGLSGLSLNLVAAEAGVAKGSLLHHFGDRASYVLELHRRWHDAIAEQVAAATADSPPGGERLVQGANCYLDICLRDRGVRTVLFEARFEPAVEGEVARRNEQFAALAAPDFEALGHGDGKTAAALFLGTVVEAALLEHRAGKRQPRVRRALAGFVGGR